MSTATLEVNGLRYYPDKSIMPTATELTPAEQDAMLTCMGIGELAMEGGNPPIGAVLLSEPRDASWSAKTIDWNEDRLLGHAELLVYLETGAMGVLKSDLTQCTLVTTAEPCTTCTAPYAEGRIGKIVYAASRTEIRQRTGIMREREINMNEMLRDGKTNTTVVGGYMREEVLGLFGVWHASRDKSRIKS